MGVRAGEGGDWRVETEGARTYLRNAFCSRQARRTRQQGVVHGHFWQKGGGQCAFDKRDA